MAQDETASEVVEKAPTGAKKVALEKIYQKKSQLEHILLRPDTYIGSVEKLEQEMWVWDIDTEKMLKRNIKYVPGLFKIFDEILVNAADNKIRDPNMTVIKVNIKKEENMIKVFNNGKGIPVQEHKDEKVFIPTLIFGHLLTSSNYDDNEKKVTGGRNGYGAKLCNIFSKKFIVETSCKESKRYFKQTWQDNMGKSQEPTIKANKEDDFTCVTFHPDLSKFGMDTLDDDLISLLAKRVYDIAASTRGVKVYLNDKRLPINKFEDYCKLYVLNNTGADSEVDLLNSSNQSGTKIIYESVNPRWEVAISYSDIGFQQISFVNSIATTKGGRHVDYVCDQIVKSLTEIINKKSGKNGTQVKPFQIKNHIWLFVNCLIENPVFESQTKECMSLQVKNFGSKCQLSDDFLKKVASRSGIVDRVVNWLAFKEKTDLEKTGPKSKQSKIKGIPKLDDANNAGTRDSINCTLILTEGDSAKTLAVAGLGVIGRDRYGVFPLRGKLLNVREATPKQILENAEITSICKIVGLNFKEKYESKDSLKQLRYGKIMIMTDQDHDGSHIKGLIINFIHHQWPNLLKHGFVEEFITPIIKVFKNRKAGAASGEVDRAQGVVERSFYSVPEFEEWQSNTPDWHTWKIKYYKGLGTSTSKEAKEYFGDMTRHCIRFEYSGLRDDLSIQLAFNKRLAEERKDWLTKFMEKRNDEKNYLYQKDTRKINFSQFVNKELVLFSNLDNERSIPCLVDGFKPGQRKVLFACFKRNLSKEIKVAQLAGSVAELSAYHHGEQSLMGTIINLAQNFVGSNNLNLLQPIGQFGTRLHGGKDAASPRYIFTNLHPLTRLLFNVKDDPLLDYINDDGQFVEPHYYCPILPMVLVNGAEGIGTGWAVKIPNFNVRDIIDNLIRLINSEEPTPMKPHYRNFLGNIERLDDSRFMVSGEVALINDENDSKNDYTVEISELPVGVWTQWYKESVLEAYLHGTESATKSDSDKTKSGSSSSQMTQYINDYKEYHTDCTVRFLVKMSARQYQHAMEQGGGLHKFFKLQKSLSLNNMVLFDSNGCLKRYESPLDILTEFYQVRYHFYIKRKEYLESMLGAESTKLDNIARFILEKIEGKIKVENLKKDVLIKTLIEKGYQPDPVRRWKESIRRENDNQEEVDNETASSADFNYLLSMPIWNLTLEKKEDILKQQREKQTELKLLKAKTAKDLWLDDLTEFRCELDRQEAKEREEANVSLKKNVAKGQKPSVAKSIKNEYLPDPIGQRVDPKIDAADLQKAEKEAQLKVANKAKKEETMKGANLVDLILDDGKFDEEKEKQIKELAANLCNPAKAKAAKAEATAKTTKAKPATNGDATEGTDASPVKQEPAAKKTPTKSNGTSSKGAKKEKEKITIDTDSEMSFDESKPNDVPLLVEKRTTARAKKEVKYDFKSDDESDDDLEVIVQKKKPKKRDDSDDSANEFTILDASDNSQIEEVAKPAAKPAAKKAPAKPKAPKEPAAVAAPTAAPSTPKEPAKPKATAAKKKTSPAAEPKKKTTAKTAKRKTAKYVDDSDEDESPEELDSDSSDYAPKKKKAPAKKPVKKAKKDDSDDDPFSLD